MPVPALVARGVQVLRIHSSPGLPEVDRRELTSDEKL